jgi:hypothetical protein
MIFKKLFKYTPTTQEQQLLDIAQDLLNHPDTVVRMTFSSRKYFLTNEKKHYYMMLQHSNVQITNTKFSFCKSIHEKAYDIALEDQIFDNENKMLEQVRTKLQLTA